MASLCRLDGDFRCFQIADFSDHDDVRVLPEERLECNGKIQPGFVVDIDLVDSRQIDFARILRRGNIDAWLVEQIEACLLYTSPSPRD